MSLRSILALAISVTVISCGAPEGIRARRGSAGGDSGAGGNPGIGGDTTSTGGTGGDTTPAGGTGGDTTPTGGTGGSTTPAGGTGGDTTPAGGTGGSTTPTGGTGGSTTPTGGTGGTPTGGAGGTPMGGTGGTPTGGTGGTPTGGAGGTPSGGTGGTPSGGSGGGGAGGTGGMVGGGPSIKIDSGATTATGAWAVDADFAPAPGLTLNHANAIDMSKVTTNPPPQVVYQTGRTGTSFTYTIPGYKAGTLHNIRLHFAETYFPAAGSTLPGPGSRVCNVTINGQAVLTNYDIFVKAGGKNIAIAEPFVLAADGSGQYVMAFVRVTDQCLIAGIEID